MIKSHCQQRARGNGCVLAVAILDSNTGPDGNNVRTVKSLSNNDNKGTTRFFLPDFCQTQSVFLVVLVAELLAILLSLARFEPHNFWPILGYYSLFIQWIALISAACLCLLRTWLRNLSDSKAALISYVVILLITLLGFLIANWLGITMAMTADAIDWSTIVSGLLMAAILAAFWLRLFYLQAQYRLRLEAETEAKLQALQARIKPHFLFNSMNILSSLIAIKPQQAEQVVEDLSALFRASLKEHRDLVPLIDEITICKHYFHIESLRLGERLSVAWNLKGDYQQFQVPSLLLQPLVENAVYHGIQPLVDGGLISIDIEANQNGLNICISNPFDPHGHKEFAGHQVAVNNIRDRLLLLYGERCRFSLEESTGQYRVIIFIPAGTDQEESDESSGR